MNVYQTIEDNQHCLYTADSFEAAVKKAEARFVRSVASGEDGPWDLDESPADYFRRVILESCQLIGELES